MGMDFTALIRCDPLTGPGERCIAALEGTGRPEPLQKVLQCWKDSGFFAFYDDWVTSIWVVRENQEIATPSRPQLPCLNAELRLPEGFFLTVASNTIVVHHLLRWHLFLTQTRWQTVMFDAMRWMCDEFAATDCVFAHDCHTVVSGVRDGLTYQEAIQFAEKKGFGEVQSFSELYVEVESECDTAMKPAKGNLAQCVRWPKDKPLPPGWTRPTAWDSRGFWRFAPR
jgi:hypothetical protein